MRALSGLCLVVLVSSLARAQEDTSDSVWAGTWTLNVAKSKEHGPAPKTETVRIEAPGGQAHPVKHAVTGTNADGSPIDFTFDGKMDGNPYPVMSSGQEVAKAALRRQSSHHYTEEETSPDGTKASLTLIIAPNGKTATVREHSTGPTGQYDAMEVWEKQP